jgi:hypothetical protein
MDINDKKKRKWKRGVMGLEKERTRSGDNPQ